MELVAGRTIQTDGVNRVQHGHHAGSQNRWKGWGYTFYEMTGTGQVASTLMAVPGRHTHKSKPSWVARPLTIRYNSRLPVVVYAPEGFEIRYRIWAAAEEYHTRQSMAEWSHVSRNRPKFSVISWHTRFVTRDKAASAVG